MKNAFNMVSREAILSECSKHFPELLPWAIWCYSQHPILWHPLGSLHSEQGVQQGDPLGPLLFSLVLNKVVSEIATNSMCADLSYHAWYLDDGVLAGPRSAVLQALSIIQEFGPPNGLIVNFPKCEIFSKHDVSPFPPEMKRSSHLNIVILGIPIGDKAFCATFISEKYDEAKALLLKLEEVSAVDPHVAFSLLRQCAGFCRLAHLARGTPPSQAISALEAFDHDIRATFSKCTAVDTSNPAWQQAELSLGRGGLGMRSLSRHSPAAYIASLSSSGAGPLSQEHLIHAVELFNSLVPLSEAVSIEEVLISPFHQKVLSCKIDNHLFNTLYEQSSAANRARLLSVSSPHAASWVSVIPSEGLGLHLQPSEFQVAIKWWLGLDTSCGSICPLCPGKVIDPLGHHALTCKRGGDVVTRHNKLRDTLAETCRRAHLSVKVEAGSNLSKDHSHTRPADILIPNWSLGKPAAFDLFVTSPLNSNILLEAGFRAGQAARATEERMHEENDAKCKELGWVCVPMVVEAYGAWGTEAMESFSLLASRLATSSNRAKAEGLAALYGRLNLILVRANATAIPPGVLSLSSTYSRVHLITLLLYIRVFM